MATTYEDPRAHDVRERYLALFGGEELPVSVEAIATDMAGVHVWKSWKIDYSHTSLTAEPCAMQTVGENRSATLERA